MELHAREACCAPWASISTGGEVLIFDGAKTHFDFLGTDELVSKRVHLVALEPIVTDIKQVSRVESSSQGAMIANWAVAWCAACQGGGLACALVWAVEAA
jgi:hypothetical protein